MVTTRLARTINLASCPQARASLTDPIGHLPILIGMKPTDSDAFTAAADQCWDSPTTCTELDAPLRLKNDGDVVAAIPYLLGFQPRESIVALVFQANRLITSVRFPIEMGDAPGQLARRIATIDRQFPDADWILAGYSSDRERAVTVIERMSTVIGPTRVLESVYANDGRFWSLSCTVPDCCPPQGRLIDFERSPVAARAVLAGMQVLDSRSDLDASIRPPRGWLGRAAMQRIEDARASIRGMELNEIEQSFTGLVQQGLDNPEAVDPTQAAQMAVMAFYPSARDQALRLLSRPHAQRHVELWRAVAKMTPRDSQPPVLGLLGLAAWVNGDGALQVVCIERAEKVAPHHPLIALLGEINAAAAPPCLWDDLRADLFGEES